MGSLDIPDILRTISDDKSLALFKMISVALPRYSQVVMSRLVVTRKQYYSRMNRLINAGLVKRENGQHLLTSLGGVAYEFLTLIGQAIENYWRLKMIDSLEESIVENDKRKIMIETLVKNSNIKRILLKSNIP